VTFTAAVSDGIVFAGGGGGICAVNVTVALCPRALAVTVAGLGSVGTAGRYTTDGPFVFESDPGPVKDHVTSDAIVAGLAVISCGPCSAGWFPLGVIVSIGWGSFPAQAARITDTAANIRLRIDVSAKNELRQCRAESLFLGCCPLSTT
jgi:hypothetical protein